MAVELHVSGTAAQLKMFAPVDNIIMSVAAYKVKIVIIVVLLPCVVFGSEIAKSH